MTDQTPKPPIDWEGAKLSAEHGMRIPLNHLNNLGRAYLALRAEVERLRNLIMDASEAYEASDPLRIEYRAILAARQEEGSK